MLALYLQFAYLQVFQEIGSVSSAGMVGLPLGSASEWGDRVVCYRVVVQQYVISNPDCV